MKKGNLIRNLVAVSVIALLLVIIATIILFIQVSHSPAPNQTLNIMDAGSTARVR